MKKDLKLWASVVLASLAVFNTLLYFSIRSMWSGIIAILGSSSPFIIMAIIFLLAVVSVLMLFFNYRKLLPSIIIFAAEIFFLAVEFYIISVTFDSLIFFIREFALAFLCLALFSLIVYALFFFPKTKLFNVKWFKTLLCFVIIAVFMFSYFGFGFNSIDSTPVVYAVNDEYQIVFTTKLKGTAWVVVDGEEYNDSYAGSRISNQTIHKISVPMEKLDNAKSYTLYSRAMFIRGPYSALQGRTISAQYNWKGVDNSNGINYYVVSDSHMTTKAVTSAANYFGEDLDFLVCAGDHANWVDTSFDALFAHKIAGAVTKGQIPVVYARGNHETKGNLANELHRYVGSDGEKFYYTFRLQNLWGVVLDLGEDHGDDWSEFYDSSRFEAYRSEQTAFLDSIIENKENEYDAEGVEVRIAICHIPVSFMYRSDHAEQHKINWVERLNQMKLTVMFSGHRHQLMYLAADLPSDTALTYYKEYAGYDGSRPDGYATNANFPMFIVSRKTTTQTITVADTNSNFTGVAVSINNAETTVKYTDQNKNVLEIMSPWFKGENYGTTFTFENK